MKIDPVHYYYKDPDSGVEMNFSMTDTYGWTVNFPHMKYGYLKDYNIDDIPWPKLTPEQQSVVDANYIKLYEALEKEDE